MTMRITDWDEAYSNAGHVADSATFPPRWQAEAAAFRKSMIAKGRAQIDIAYSTGQRNQLDIYLPETAARGLVVFVHGGYWMRFDKSFWSQLAAGPLEHGFAVAMPSYTLCPDIRIAGITQEVTAAIQAAAGRVDGEIRLTGHSAGGHLVTRMMCSDSPLNKNVLRRVSRVVSISGVHDLRPLMRTEMNDTLHIDAAEARAESPVLAEPTGDIALTCWVGAAELPEFCRQNALLASIWSGCGANTEAVEEPDKHHFNVVEGLGDPGHGLTRCLCE